MSWIDANSIYQALTKAHLPVCGVAAGASPHETQFGATFIRCGATTYRVDWQRQPSDQERQEAGKIIGEGSDPQTDSPELIDSASNEYPSGQQPQQPRRVSDIVAFYRYPRAWFGSNPNIGANNRDATCVFDEVYRDRLENGINIRVLRLGIFVFDFSESIFRASSHTDQSLLDDIANLSLKRLSALNAYLLCLVSAIASHNNFAERKQLLRLNDILVSATFENSRNIFYGGREHENIPRYSEMTDSFFRHAAGGDILRHNTIVKWQADIRQTIDTDIIRDSFRSFTKILTQPLDFGLYLVSLLAEAYKAFEDFNYALALITSWAVTEKLLNEEWLKFVSSPAEQLNLRFDGKRRDRLKDSRTFTAAVAAEILEFQGVLPKDLYELSTVVRKARNDWMHGLKKIPTRDEAAQALDLATGMLKHFANIDLKLYTVSSLQIRLASP